MASSGEPAEEQARRREVVQKLKKLGVSGILITAAEIGDLKEVACAIEPCLCPAELGGKSFFAPIPEEISDWIPTQDHKILKSEGGTLTVENVQLAHRLCNRVRNTGEPGKRDMKRIEAAQEMALSGMRFRIMKDGVEVATATSYSAALDRAQAEGADRVLDTSTGAMITLPPR